jgi:hypothetical protein
MAAVQWYSGNEFHSGNFGHHIIKNLGRSWRKRPKENYRSNKKKTVTGIVIVTVTVTVIVTFTVAVIVTVTVKSKATTFQNLLVKRREPALTAGVVGAAPS